MAKIRDYSKLSRDILSEIGGEENLINFSRCATRLRLVLKTLPPNAINNIKKMPGVITVLFSGGQLQVVIGTHVGQLYQAMAERVNPAYLAETPPNKRWLDSVVATMSAVFAPIIYVLAAAGILQGILIIVSLFPDHFNQTSTYAVLNFISWTPFAFLPVFIAITAAQHFKCNVYIAVFCCCALINPSWTVMAAQIAEGKALTFLYLPLAQTVYSSSVLPPLFLVWGLSWLERVLERRLPEVIKQLLLPLLCVVIMVPITLLFIGPITSGGAKAIAVGYTELVNTVPALAAVIIGGFWQVIVIFGIHWGITPVVIENFKLYGRDSFQAFQTIAVVGQMAAAFACAMRTKQKKLKRMAYSAGITAIFGITEPTIYGVTLPLKKPFIYGCIGGAAGALVSSLFGSYYYAYAGLPSLITTVNTINAQNPHSYLGEMLGVGVAIVVTFSLVYLFRFPEPNEDTTEINIEANSTVYSESALQVIAANHNVTTVLLLSPLSGDLIPLSEVKDSSFASKLLGDGVAILPTDNVLRAPCDATVVSTLDSQHAIGLQCDNGAELLLHLGLDTVNLHGEHFNMAVKMGQRVTVGEPLIYFDTDEIIHKGFDLTTPCLIVNSEEYLIQPMLQQGNVTAGQPMLNLVRQQ